MNKINSCLLTRLILVCYYKNNKGNHIGGVTYIHDERVNTVKHATDGWRVSVRRNGMRFWRRSICRNRIRLLSGG